MSGQGVKMSHKTNQGADAPAQPVSPGDTPSDTEIEPLGVSAADAAQTDSSSDESDDSTGGMGQLINQLRRQQIALEQQNQELQRVQFERELAWERYAALFHTVPVGYISLDQDGLILQTNQTATQLLQQLPAKLIGQRLSRFVVPADQDSYHKFLQSMAGSDEPQQARLRLEQPDGAQIFVLFKGHHSIDSIAIDPHGQQRIEYQLVLSDVNALAETEQAYQTLVDNALQGLAIIQDGQFVFANVPLTFIFGYSREEILAWSLADIAALLLPEDRLPVLQNISGEALTPQLETRFIHKNGERRWVETHAARITYRGRPALQVSFLDITERKQAEVVRNRLLAQFKAQREQLKALTARLAEVQEAERKALARELHDQVGQQLTSLNLNLTTLRAHFVAASATLPQPVLSLVDHSLMLVEETTGRIQDVLANLRPPVLDDYGLMAALHWYAAEMETQADFSIQVRGIEPDPRLAAPVELALFRIVQETLNNVVKHSQAKKVTINLESNRVVRLTIIDDGVGFVYKRHQNPAKRAGLGLLTISERAEAVRGFCRIESQPGVGTRITVEVPR